MKTAWEEYCIFIVLNHGTLVVFIAEHQTVTYTFVDLNSKVLMFKKKNRTIFCEIMMKRFHSFKGHCNKQ